MHPQNLLLLALTCLVALALTTSAHPASQLSSELALRSDESLYGRDIAHYLNVRDDLVSEFQIFKRAPPLSAHQVNDVAAKVLQSNNAGQKKRTAKQNINQKTMKRVKPQPKTPGFSKMNQEERAKVDETRKKNDRTAKSQAIGAAQKQAKADRKTAWDSKKLDPAARAAKDQERTDRRAAGLAAGAPKGLANTPSTKQPKMDPAQRQQVNDALKNAGTRMQATANIPGRKDTFAVGSETWSGKEVRKGVMNSHLFSSAPLGNGPGVMPKTFRNDPYNPSHTNAQLAGKPVVSGIPAGHPPLQEFPVMKNSPSGFRGRTNPGPGRVLTSTAQSGQDTFHGVIAHDLNAGGSQDDHYLATHTKKN